jgi:hypothetical protein
VRQEGENGFHSLDGRIWRGTTGGNRSCRDTIASALYARREANRTPPAANLPLLEAKITSYLGIYEIADARQFKVQYESCFSHPTLDFTVAVDGEPSGTGLFKPTHLFINVILPGATEPERPID